MRKLLWKQEDQSRIADWVAKQVSQNAPWGPYSALGVEDENGDIIAGVVYDGYVKGARCSMHCSGIGKKWLSRKFLWMCFDFPFNQLGVKVIINPVDSINEASARFTEHCGFTQHASIKNGCGDSDLLIYTLHRDDCRWLGVKHD